MADQLQIDDSTLLDNLDARQVEFDGEADGDRFAFAVGYDVLEALGTVDAASENAVALVQRFRPQIEAAAISALQRDYDRERVIVSENDLA